MLNSYLLTLLFLLIGVALGLLIHWAMQRPTAERRLAVLAVIELSPNGITFRQLQTRLFLKPNTLQAVLRILTNSGIICPDEFQHYRVKF